VLGEVTAQVITDQISVPAQRVLHLVRRRIDDQTMAAVITRGG
jgi:hypothetical protein